MRPLLKYLLPLLFALNASAQGTLVFSADFEIDSDYYCSHSTFRSPPPYDSTTFQHFYPYAFWSLNSTDIYSPCDSFINSFGETVPYWNAVPKNLQGYQYPNSGNNYVGLATYIEDPIDPSWEYYREWIGIKLNSPLKTNTYYKIEMYVSIADSSYWATPPPQVYFDADSISFSVMSISNNSFGMIDYNNVVRLDTAICTDTVNWTKISGYYGARGGETFLYIGNFYNDDNTNATFLDSINFKSAYFYIDDLSLFELDSTFIGLSESPAQQITLFPNPATNTLTISTGNLQNAQVELFDTSGRKLFQQNLTTSQQRIDVSGYANGLYICAIRANGKVVRREKIVISR